MSLNAGACWGQASGSFPSLAPAFPPYFLVDSQRGHTEGWKELRQITVPAKLDAAALSQGLTAQKAPG